MKSISVVVDGGHFNHGVYKRLTDPKKSADLVNLLIKTIETRFQANISSIDWVQASNTKKDVQQFFSTLQKNPRINLIICGQMEHETLIEEHTNPRCKCTCLTVRRRGECGVDLQCIHSLLFRSLQEFNSTLVLISGDADLLPTLDFIRNNPKKFSPSEIYVLGTKSSTALALHKYVIPDLFLDDIVDNLKIGS